MSTFPVSPEKEAALARRMENLRIREEDLDEMFVRSGGHGGQNVNKTSTCVVLLHRPSGIQVKYQSTRQQGLNRFFARHLLLDKIEAGRRARAAAVRDEVEKLRRRNRPRPRGVKERMLDQKSRHSAKKASRRAADLE